MHAMNKEKVSAVKYKKYCITNILIRSEVSTYYLNYPVNILPFHFHSVIYLFANSQQISVHLVYFIFVQ